MVGLEREVRHALLGVGGNERVTSTRSATTALAVGCAQPRAVVERRPDGVALDEDRVHHALDVGDQPPRRHERGMHAKLDSLGGSLRDAEQLDAVASSSA